MIERKDAVVRKKSLMKVRPIKILPPAAEIFIAAATVVSACSIDGHHGNGDDNYFSAFATLPHARWAYSDAKTFEVDTLADSISQPGDVVLTVRHTSGYSYSNIWVELSMDVADTAARRDTFNIRLADIYGRWLGKGMGTSLQKNDTLLRNVAIRRHQPIRLRHIMRTDTLSDIEQVGISFFPHKL